MLPTLRTTDLEGFTKVPNGPEALATATVHATHKRSIYTSDTENTGFLLLILKLSHNTFNTMA